MAKDIDYHRIEIEYRANKLSLRDIAQEFGVSEGMIRKKAKAEGWQRDLSQYVSKRTQEKLVRRSVSDKEATDKEVVEEISDRNANVIESHRTDIKTARGCAGILLDELMDSTKNYVSLEALIEEQATEEDWSASRKETIMRAVSLPSRVRSMGELATAMKTLQGLERTAYGLDQDDEGDNEKSLSEALNEGIKRIRGE